MPNERLKLIVHFQAFRLNLTPFLSRSLTLSTICNPQEWSPSLWKKTKVSMTSDKISIFSGTIIVSGTVMNVSL